MSNPVKHDTGNGRWGRDLPALNDARKKRGMHPLGPCPFCGSWTEDYGGGWACGRFHCSGSPEGFAVSSTPAPDWWNTDIRVFMDGDKWCATGEGFENLQESPAGFGDTPQQAVDDLRRNQAQQNHSSAPEQAATENAALPLAARS